MMPIRMLGNFSLHYDHDKLPPPLPGPSSETRRRKVRLGLRVSSAIDLDCSFLLLCAEGVAGDLDESHSLKRLLGCLFCKLIALFRMNHKLRQTFSQRCFLTVI